MVSTVTMKTTKSADGSNPGVQVAYLSGRYTLLLNFPSSVALEATFCKEWDGNCILIDSEFKLWSPPPKTDKHKIPKSRVSISMAVETPWPQQLLKESV